MTLTFSAQVGERSAVRDVTFEMLKVSIKHLEEKLKKKKEKRITSHTFLNCSSLSLNIDNIFLKKHIFSSTKSIVQSESYQTELPFFFTFCTNTVNKINVFSHNPIYTT